MKNRNVMKPAILYLAPILIFLISCQGGKKELFVKTKNTSKPNIIYILADDLGYADIGCYGQTKFNTPNIDKLAKNGMLFTQHYSGSTVCAPSRSSLMTGLHTGHTFIRGNYEIQPEGQYPMASSEVTVAEFLKKAGYVTGAFGKWGLGYPGSEGDPNNQGFDEFYGFNCQRLGHNYYPYHLWHNQTKEVLKKNQGQDIGTYAPEIIHEKAMAFLEKNKDTTFFMYYPSIIPHAELLVPDNYMKKFKGKFLPEKIYKGVNSSYSKSGKIEYQKKGGYSFQAEPHAAFAAMVSLLDEQVGDIQKRLETLGIADNTLIIFTSDNGPHKEGGADPDYFDSNGKLKGYKRDLYEGGIRVPMIAYWPKTIKENTTSNHVSAFWDVLPTITDLVGIEIPKNTDGISFLPELLGEKQDTHHHLYWEFLEGGGKQAVRMGTWKGIRLNVQSNPDTPIALYNLKEDIGETNDLSSQHPNIVVQIDSIMKKEHRKSKDFSFKYEK